MVAKFLLDNKPEIHLKIKFALFQTSLILFHLICQMLAKFSGLNSKGPYLSLEKTEKLFVVFTYSVKQVHEIRKFHVAVVQRWLKNVQKSVMHVQSCCFANLNLLLFCPSLCRRRCCCLSSLLLWSKNFASMVTWHLTSPVYFDRVS